MKRSALLVVVFLSLVNCPLEGQLAARLYQQACDEGSMLECNLLGIMYATGDGVTQDLARAVTLLQQACDGDVMQSCSRLGVMYANGAGVPQDFGRAVALLQQACDAGEAQGCSQLDQLFRVMTVALLQQLPLDDRVLAMGVEASSTLSDADPEVLDGQYTQAWALELSAGQDVTVDVTSSDFDAHLWVTGPGLLSGLSDDDSGGGCNARITFAAPEDGQYRASVNTSSPGATGEFVLRVSDTPRSTASGPCRLAAAGGGDLPGVMVYDSSDELPCEYEVIETVSGSSSRALTSADDYESMRADVLGRAGANIGADAVIAPEGRAGVARRAVRQPGGRVRYLDPAPLPSFSGEAIRFIPGTCGGRGLK